MLLYTILAAVRGTGRGLFRVNGCVLDVGTGQELRCRLKLGLGAIRFSATVGPMRFDETWQYQSETSLN